MFNMSILKVYFDELCKGNISILDTNAKIMMAESSEVFLNKKDNEWSRSSIEDLKWFIMICNLLYNRTDMLVLPVDDGVYDLLLEKYKTFDPNFQVGSAVVNFKSKIEDRLIEQGKKLVQNPFVFIKKENRDDLRQHYQEQILRFDQRDRYNYQEIFDKNNIYDDSISKRTHDTKHNHPQLVGTLDKCKFVLDSDAIEKDAYDDPKVKVLERDFFVDHINRGIITENQVLDMVIELKYDGISVEADCTDEVVSARTRGDTGIGEAADITPILKGYKFYRNTVLKDRPVGVKFEAIMSKTDLESFNKARNYSYANCRTAIIGLFGASDANQFRDYITLVPLALDRDNVPEVHNRMEEIELLNTLYKSKGEPLRYCYINGTYKECLYQIKKFSEEAIAARDYLNFAFDGIVVSYLDENIRNRLGRENYINKFSMAVKFNPEEKLTTFLGYTFEVGQTGNICPMIHYSPVEFFGTVHPKSSGASLKRFNDLALKVGDVIMVTYTNDVMPYVTSIDCEQNRENPNPLCEFPKVCPVCETPLVISDSGKSAICPNILCHGRVVSRMVNMLQKLNMKGFADSTINALELYHFRDLFNLVEDEVANIIGPTNASNFMKIVESLKSLPIEDYRIMGALGFSGVGPQKWKLILSQMPLRDIVKILDGIIINNEFDGQFSLTIKGVGSGTIKVIIDEYKYFRPDIQAILDNCHIIDSKDIKLGKSIRFTGCRNKQLEELLITKGYDADGNASVTKSTDILIVPYDGFTSTKTSKVSENTMIIPIQEFIDHMDKYL